MSMKAIRRVRVAFLFSGYSIGPKTDLIFGKHDASIQKR